MSWSRREETKWICEELARIVKERAEPKESQEKEKKDIEKAAYIIPCTGPFGEVSGKTS